MAAAVQLRRGETKTAQERGRKGVMRARNFNVNLGNKLTMTEGVQTDRRRRLLPAGSKRRRWLARGKGGAE